MGSDDQKPHLRLAVENDHADIVRERAKREFEWPLRELAANLIRVVRGAGKSYEIGTQCMSVVEAFERYRQKVGEWPTSWDLNQALSIATERHEPPFDEEWERACASETILRGSLQTAASRLVRQRTQEARGDSELFDGVNRLMRLREEARQRRLEEERAQRKAKRPVTRKKAVKRKPKPRATRPKVDDEEIKL